MEYGSRWIILAFGKVYYSRPYPGDRLLRIGMIYNLPWVHESNLVIGVF